MIYSKYQRFIEERLSIINKSGQDVAFMLNEPQKAFITRATGKDIILKARQQGFSSLVGAIFLADFLLDENSVSIVLADNSDNATGLLEKVKYYLKSYEEKTKIKIPLKYNSKYELVNEAINTRYQIGTAENTEFGRSKTIKNLHMSEAAFYPHLRKMMASALQAVRPDGRVVIETTANGFNDFKEFWDESERGSTGFSPLFFKATEFYDKSFLEQKQKELGRLFVQEYPESPAEAFLTSGDSYFNLESLAWYMGNANDPIQNYV